MSTPGCSRACRLLRLLGSVVLGSMSLFSVGMAQDAGKFFGPVVTKWLEETGADRTMELVEEFKYVDPTGKVWTAPKGAKIDGASIPPLFWQTVGPPFVGDYRRASVIHDYYCFRQNEPWQRVHRMFYAAALSAGVSEGKAKIMYAAIYAGGPRWKERGVLGAQIIPAPDVSQVEMDEIAGWIERESPSLAEIEARVAIQ